MKHFLPLILLILAGCQAAPSAPAVPLKILPAVAPQVASASPAVPALVDLQMQVRQQAQYIEALLSQNEALKSGLPPRTGTIPPAAAGPASPIAANSLPVTAPAKPLDEATEPMLVPNADGVIDLTAPAAGSGAAVNPFAVRATREGAGREMFVHLSGLIAGPKACAVVNERLVEAGDTVEPFRVERIDPEFVLLRFGERRLRLPLSETPVRVRLPY